MSEPTPIEVIRVKPSELLFDPNSFRLVRNRLGPVVPDESIPDDGFQGDAFTWLIQSNLDDLTDSIQRHGWLEVSPLIARRLANGRLVLIDGNRRLAALRQVSVRERKWRVETVAVTVEPEPESERCSFELALRHRLTTTPWFSISRLLWAEDHRARLAEPATLSGRRDDLELLDRSFELLSVLRRVATGLPYLSAAKAFDDIALRLIAAGKIDWLQGANEELDDRLVRAFVDWLVGYDQPFDAMQSLPYRTAQIPAVARLMREPEIRRLIASGSELRQVLPTDESWEVASGTTMPWDYVTDQPVAFEDVHIRAFRGLNDIRLEGLKRVNLIVGVNNAGKTSVLEALFILTRLADPRGLLDTLRVRTRLDPETMPLWLAKLIHNLPLDLSATVSGLGPLAIDFGRVEAPPGSDVSAFVLGFSLSATLGDTKQITETLLFSNRLRSTIFKAGKARWLAPSILHTPYAFVVKGVDSYDSQQDRIQKVRADWYAASMAGESRKLILEAIQEAIDPDIDDIRLGPDVRPEHRFLVDHKHRGTMDLAMYGEGIQRIFELGNLFAAHQNGIVLIDEVETAIHVSALIRFSRLIQELAVKFNVQVFLTTHSKEAVDAFILNDYCTDDIAAFGMYRIDGKLVVDRYDGPTLADLHKALNIDIRRP